MNLDEKFFQFLRSDRDREIFEYDEKSKMMISKIKYNDKLDILFSLQSYRGNFFDLNTPFSYSGIYDKEKDKLYDLDYNLRTDIVKWDWNDERNISSDTLFLQINKEINDKIYELVEEEKKSIFNFDNINMDFEDDVIDKDVTKDFILGITSKTYKDKIKQYNSTSSQNILDYLTNREEFIEEKSREFILNNMDDIMKNLINSDGRRKALKEIEDNKEHYLHKIKNIVDSLKDKNYVTINVTINKDGIEQTFKYDASSLKNNYNSSYLSSYNITNPTDRSKFLEAFNYGDFHYEDIVKLTYGKNVVYEDKDFGKKKEKDIEL